MLSSGLIEPILGGIVGFALAQAANLGAWTYGWFTRPVLVIELLNPNSTLLTHGIDAGESGMCTQEFYGFVVRNKGRSISRRVRAQLYKIECRERGLEDYSTISEATFGLAAYNRAQKDRGLTEVDLVPGASVEVKLAAWTGDFTDLVVPAVSSLPDYYEETCSGAGDFAFSVVAFDDTARFAKKVITVRTEDARTSIANGDWFKPRAVNSLDIFE